MFRFTWLFAAILFGLALGSASFGADKPRSPGTKQPPKQPDSKEPEVKVEAAEGDTAIAIRGRPETGGDDVSDRLLARLDDLNRRLAALEARLLSLEGKSGPRTADTGPAAVGSAARASTKKGRDVGGDALPTENVTLNVTGSAARASTQRTPGGPGADIRASEGDTAMAIRGRPATQPAGRAFTIAPNPELKGRLGRLVVAFPESAKPSGTRINIYKAGEEKAIGGAYGGIAAELMPGKYSVEISNQRLNDIEVQSKNDTTIHVGVLRVSAGGDTRLDVLAADGETKLTGGYGEQVIGLPIGIYHLQVAGTTEPVTIQKDQVTDF